MTLNLKNEMHASSSQGYLNNREKQQTALSHLYPFWGGGGGEGKEEQNERSGNLMV